MVLTLFRNGRGNAAKGKNRLSLCLSVVWIALVAAVIRVDGGAPDIELVLVKAGAFTMGCASDNCFDREKPAHEVTLTNDFYIGKYPVTQRQWEAIMGNNPSRFRGDSRPVEQVNWEDIQRFITRLNALTGRNFRLPTEAEWEFAARGGLDSEGHSYAGSGVISEVAWYGHFDGGNSGMGTHQVGAKDPNELGIHDMTGNVWEWINDIYWSYTAEAKTNPTGRASGRSRVIRGGSWASHAQDCRITFRNQAFPDYRAHDIGFRLALTP
ncbi:MAG: formylglycine-generating enzyme family protein [Chitinispirillales bacterium]|jgi:formylglycine-generating enzyme required for sulfatase activity|nr:formylglycine-generating enzyme family protein [Chitinispirillales bacterium]